MKYKIKWLDLEIEITKELLITQVQESILPIIIGLSILQMGYSITDYEFWGWLSAFMLGIYFYNKSTRKRYDKIYDEEYEKENT